MTITVYVSTVTPNQAMKKQQQHIIDILSPRKVDLQTIDISDPSNEEAKQFMRANSKAKAGQTVPIPPQIFADGEYIGDYDAFVDATEDEQLDQFLKLAPATQTSQATVSLEQESSEIKGDKESESKSGEEESHNNPNETERTEPTETADGSERLEDTTEAKDERSSSETKEVESQENIDDTDVGEAEQSNEQTESRTEDTPSESPQKPSDEQHRPEEEPPAAEPTQDEQEAPADTADSKVAAEVDTTTVTKEVEEEVDFWSSMGKED